MGTRKTHVPAIPTPTEHNLVAVALALKEGYEVAEMRRGDVLDAKVTFRDLIDGGLAAAGSLLNQSGSLGGPALLDDSEPGPNSGFLKPPSYDGKVLPGRPANVRTYDIWDGIQVVWDWPEAAGTNWYWKRAIVWVSPTPSFEHAQVAGYTTMAHFTHADIGLTTTAVPGFETQAGVRYYWVAWEGNWNDVNGAPDRSESNPYHWADGVRGQTAVNPTYMLELMTGQITESHIYDILNQRINLVDFDPANPNTPLTEPVETRILLAFAGSTEGVYAAIAEQATASVSEDGLTAQGDYAIHVDLDGYIVGFGLSAFSRIVEDAGGNPTRENGSTFLIRAEEFAIAAPLELVYAGQPGIYKDPETIFPFIVKKVAGEWTVGIDGNLVVDGTITARHIAAETIGVDQINTNLLYADLVQSDLIMTGKFATSEPDNMRLEINGEGESKELFPLWYGSGPTGGDESVIYFEKNGTVRLAGDLWVTGAGKFFAGNQGQNEWRVEIGGPQEIRPGVRYLLWAGAGNKTASNDEWAFYIDESGEAKFKGTVEAEFVSGEISRTHIIGSDSQDTASIVSTANDADNVSQLGAESHWKDCGEWPCPEPPFDSGHIPYISVASVLGGGIAGAMRLRWKPHATGSWRNVALSAYDMANYGETKIQIGVGTRVHVESFFKLQISGFDTHSITNFNRKGIVMGIR